MQFEKGGCGLLWEAFRSEGELAESTGKKESISSENGGEQSSTSSNKNKLMGPNCLPT